MKINYRLRAFEQMCRTYRQKTLVTSDRPSKSATDISPAEIDLPC